MASRCFSYDSNPNPNPSPNPNPNPNPHPNPDPNPNPNQVLELKLMRPARRIELALTTTSVQGWKVAAGLIAHE
eukprot:scaffold127087_cov27-Phaeocystis_antarctica.AAC.1